jgi:hypothetical protein
MHDSLSGSARLATPYERDFIEFIVDARGHFRIRGHFEFFDDGVQRLDFELAADQTYLPPFIASLDATLAQHQKA